jgi:transcriptional regulator with GAF, ATPase, and Fis domain
VGGGVVRAVVGAIVVASLRWRFALGGAEPATGRAVVARAPEMARLIDKTLRLARRDIPVLVRGETGTGKEIIASLLHAESARADRPLVRFNCAAIPAELAEAELFGHVKGAFTGAIAARRGFFREADGGTLVLDEVGELPLGLQAKLLRAVQEGEIQPVGAGRVEKVDVRVIASTNRDLLAEALAKRFREDLYYRLAVVELVVPPLRQRREDVAALARVFAARYAERFGVERVTLSPELIAALSARAWPGNVRELESTIARLVATSEDGALRASDLEPRAETAGAESFREKVSAYERALIVEALDAADGNQSEAARRLGMSRVTLIDRIKRLEIT